MMKDVNYSWLNLKELKALDNIRLSTEELENIEENEHVLRLQNNGNSGLYNNNVWYTAILSDNTEINLYEDRTKNYEVEDYLER